MLLPSHSPSYLKAQGNQVEVPEDWKMGIVAPSVKKGGKEGKGKWRATDWQASPLCLGRS